MASCTLVVMENEIWNRLIDGDTAKEIDIYLHGEDAREIAAAVGASLASFDESAANLASSVHNLAEAFDCLGTHGWATTSGGAPLQQQAEAVELISVGKFDEANTLLCEGWEMLADRIVGQVACLHYGDRELSDIAAARGELVSKAVSHHRNGAYEASILILLTQIEGIVMDLTGTPTVAGGKYFYRTKKGASATDEETVVGIDGALNHVREWFCKPCKVTGFGGDLSRHGLLHGRQLGFDTRENSARCIALLGAVVEFARPLAEQLAQRRSAERQAADAGSDEVDERWIRKDRRGFTDARLRLKDLCAIQSVFRGANGRLANDSELRKLNVQGAHLVTETSVGDCWSGYTQAESGLFFGLAERGTEFRYFEGESEPPELESDGWSDEQTPNWSGDVY
jgi:hypothetical protein